MAAPQGNQLWPADKVERRKVVSLVPYARNSRTHSDAQIGQIAASITEWGWTTPILIDPKGGLIAGHARILAAQKIGIDEVPCVVADGWTDAQIQAYVIADNKLAINAGWDDDMLKVELGELKGLDFDLDLIGFNTDELAEMFQETTEGLTDEDSVPEPPETPVTVEGDVWLLGRHRLMCGDSTSIDAVDNLMDGHKADMVFTDPPYNIGFKGTMSSTSKDGVLMEFKTENTKYSDIHNDSKTEQDFKSFITDILSMIRMHCVGGWYICFASTTLHELLTPLAENDMKWKSLIIWNKNQSPMGGGHYRKKYEPIAYGYFSNLFYGKEYSEDDVWNINRTVKNDLHPTMKPVELVEKAVGFSSNAGGVCLDLFGGAGPTLIACEKLSRTARIMELDPKYCDVITNRWQDFTGETATLEESGQTYNELKAERVDG